MGMPVCRVDAPAVLAQVMAVVATGYRGVRATDLTAVRPCDRSDGAGPTARNVRSLGGPIGPVTRTRKIRPLRQIRHVLNNPLPLTTT
ncbi:hypothetical protein AB0D74_49940, partial [Streptomyces sp. NPDC048278]|uniref:hypothetical protein n=1 Tax=Streptomyces sp. NPDC048278 TaxID=3155809 RepID=UPI0034403013